MCERVNEVCVCVREVCVCALSLSRARVPLSSIAPSTHEAEPSPPHTSTRKALCLLLNAFSASTGVVVAKSTTSSTRFDAFASSDALSRLSCTTSPIFAPALLLIMASVGRLTPLTPLPPPSAKDFIEPSWLEKSRSLSAAFNEKMKPPRLKPYATAARTAARGAPAGCASS